MPGFYVRLTDQEIEAIREEAARDRRPAQDEAAILIAEALRQRRLLEESAPKRRVALAS